jgi:chromosome partitioning protein
MIIALASQKGGVGKSTIATNIATALAISGKDVMLVDADRQGTSANWANDRQDMHPTRPPVHMVQKFDNIKAALMDLDRRYNYVIVDCVGRDSKEMRSALMTADIAIIPLQCSQPDLDTLHRVGEAVSEAQDLNPKLRACVVLSRVPTNPVIKEEEAARKVLQDFPTMHLLEARICDRKVYRDAVSSGQGVVELPHNKGRDEIDQLLNEVFAFPNITITAPLASEATV